jgi:hypothetical protein
MVGALVGPLSYTLFGDYQATQVDTAVRGVGGRRSLASPTLKWKPSKGFHAFPRFGSAIAIAALDLDSPLRIWK